MSSTCEEAECSDCGSTGECVVEHCVESGGDSALCCCCAIEEGSLEPGEECEDHKDECE
jgi:hypothetical protein